MLKSRCMLDAHYPNFWSLKGAWRSWPNFKVKQPENFRGWKVKWYCVWRCCEGVAFFKQTKQLIRDFWSNCCWNLCQHDYGSIVVNVFLSIILFEKWQHVAREMSFTPKKKCFFQVVILEKSQDSKISITKKSHSLL